MLSKDKYTWKTKRWRLRTKITFGFIVGLDLVAGIGGKESG